jgi:hypothetical protein
VQSEPRNLPEVGTFLAELEARRAAVLAQVVGLEQPASGEGVSGPEVHAHAARYVFALLTGAARAGHTELRDDALRALASRMSTDLDAPLVAVGSERLALAAMLSARPPPSEQIEALNALFAAGFAAELAPLDPSQRRELTLQVVRLLPGVERLGPFVLSDYVDQACQEEDAVRFWQVYVDRVAAEITRRTAETPASREPWLLIDLLRLHEQGPAAMEVTFPNLKVHMNRVLQARRDRWRFVRSMAEACSDAHLLYTLCTTQAMVEDPEVVAVFLERGDPRLISCALATLQLHPDHHAPVERALEHFQGRPLPEVGERLVEIHAQACLPREPTAPVTRLIAGIRALVQRRVAEGAPVETLLGSVANDPRALRQVTLLAHGAPPGSQLPQRRHLLERVIGVWLQSFTPGGVRHPLNDAVFRTAVGVAGRLLVEEGSDLPQRLERFALELPALARRWHPQDEAERRRTLSRFLAVFGHGTSGMLPGAQPAASVALHGVLVRVYVALPSARGNGWFGGIDQVLPALFPDLLRGSPSPERLSDAAGRIAALALEATPRGASLERPDAAKATVPAVEAAPITAPVEVLPRAPSTARTVLGAWLGVELVTWLARTGARLVGMRRRGEAMLTGGTLRVQTEARLLGKRVDDLEERQALDQLAGVRIRQQMRFFPVVLGLAVLAGTAVVGGQLIFAGLRAGELAQALPGLGFIVLGLLFDGAMTHLASLGRHTVVLELFGVGRTDPLALQVDTRAGAPFLDAVLAADARRRELARYARWAAQDETWTADAPAEAEAEAPEVAGKESEPAKEPADPADEPPGVRTEAASPDQVPTGERAFGAAEGLPPEASERPPKAKPPSKKR